MTNPLLGNDKLSVINMGLPSFAESLAEQGAAVTQLQWKPAADAKPELLSVLARINRAGKELSALQEKIEAANKQAVERLNEAQAIWTDVQPARDVVKGFHDNLILHAGPPIAWEKMCGPMQGAIAGALIYEGKAKTFEEACVLAESGKIEFAPCHHYQMVGPMAGVVSPSMWVSVVHNPTHGNYAYCTLNEGLGKVLRFGAYDEEVMTRLKWMEKVLAPALSKAVKHAGGINIKALIAQALQMGDELHNRNNAGTSLLLRELHTHLCKCGLSLEVVEEVYAFINANNHFFLNFSMPAGKVAADAIKGIEYSTIMCAMCRNGVEIGIRVAGTGDRWYTTQSGIPKGLYFGGYSEADANRDLGDSTICETAGFGGFAMATAPAIVKFTGGDAEMALRITNEMYDICYARHRDYQMPILDFAGTPLGVDIRKVVELSSTPYINTGIAHKKAGIGQVGAGLLRAPMPCFQEALLAMGEWT
ncbi:MAG: DUF1116 domain-containing protein [Bradymonadales bacterium]